VKNINRNNTVKTLAYALKDGSIVTRLSFPFMGFGQFARGQIGKGVFYTLTQIAFTLYLIFFGGEYIEK
jgi:arabinogalactan oligomer/maltooligosaccharide transport system permease protein